MVGNIDIASYANDNTPYSLGKSQCDLQTKLQKASIKLFKWFHVNGLKANLDKCHFLARLDINEVFATCLHTRKLKFSKTSWCNN